jgi:large conductance mechanosensitive channel
MKKMFQEFKTFALKGSVVDLAVGVNFSNLKIVLKAAAEGQPEVAISYGLFLQTIVTFLIVAWALFMLIQLMNRLYREEKAAPPPPPATPEDVLLLREIRDALKK